MKLYGDGIPKRYLDATRATIPAETWAWLDERGKTVADAGLFIHGDAGIGKTWLATAIIQEYRGMWATVPGVLLDLRRTISHPDKWEEDVLDHYLKPHVLLLDDLGAEKATDWTGQSLYYLISTRMNRMLSTIVTSNLDLARIDAMDPRLASRLGGMVILAMRGKDRRREV